MKPNWLAYLRECFEGAAFPNPVLIDLFTETTSANKTKLPSPNYSRISPQAPCVGSVELAMISVCLMKKTEQQGGEKPSDANLHV
jgi:hypothetical protein